MKIYLVRHGEPSYTPCTVRKLKGQGRDLAALNDDGIKQILAITIPKLVDCDAQIILSSPYTRSLQTAALIASKVGLVTKVVHDLHEWVPDMTFNYESYKELMAIYLDFYNNKGILPSDEVRTAHTLWEPLDVFRQRVLNALIHVSESYSSVIVTAHGMVIQSLTGKHIDYGDVIEITLDGNYELPTWTFNAPRKQD